MSRILEALESFFRDEEWVFLRVGDSSTLQVRFRGESGEWACYALARDEQERLLFYSVAPLSVPLDKRMDVAEFLTRANYGMLIGNFEMDFSDGEVRYKTAFDIPGVDLTPQLIRSVVYVNVMTMDRYLPGLMSVLYGDTLPSVAVLNVESA